MGLLIMENQRAVPSSNLLNIVISDAAFTI